MGKISQLFFFCMCIFISRFLLCGHFVFTFALCFYDFLCLFIYCFVCCCRSVFIIDYINMLFYTRRNMKRIAMNVFFFILFRDIICKILWVRYDKCKQVSRILSFLYYWCIKIQREKNLTILVLSLALFTEDLFHRDKSGSGLSDVITGISLSRSFFLKSLHSRVIRCYTPHIQGVNWDIREYMPNAQVSLLFMLSF
jgi:hypothetical protein